MQDRFRITVHLPNGTANESIAYSAMIGHIRGLDEVGGYTNLNVTGFWWDGASWVRDRITLVTTDVERSMSSDSALDNLVLSLKEFAAQQYSDYGCAQDEIWITAHPIKVYAQDAA